MVETKNSDKEPVRIKPHGGRSLTIRCCNLFPLPRHNSRRRWISLLLGTRKKALCPLSHDNTTVPRGLFLATFSGGRSAHWKCLNLPFFNVQIVLGLTVTCPRVLSRGLSTMSIDPSLFAKKSVLGRRMASLFHTYAHATAEN